jgi:hypothetical protein
LIQSDSKRARRFWSILVYACDVVLVVVVDQAGLNRLGGGGRIWFRPLGHAFVPQPRLLATTAPGFLCLGSLSRGTARSPSLPPNNQNGKPLRRTRTRQRLNPSRPFGAPNRTHQGYAHPERENAHPRIGQRDGRGTGVTKTNQATGLAGPCVDMATTASLVTVRDLVLVILFMEPRRVGSQSDLQPAPRSND